MEGEDRTGITAEAELSKGVVVTTPPPPPPTNTDRDYGVAVRTIRTEVGWRKEHIYWGDGESNVSQRQHFH